MEGSLIIKGNYYYAKFRVNGKQKMLATKVPVKGNNKRKAERVLKELIAKYEGLNLENENVLFTAFLDKWLQSVKPILKPATWESYDKTVSGKIKPYFEQKNYRFREMKPEIFTEYFVYLATEGKSNGKGGLSHKTVKNIRGVLSSAYEYAIENSYIKDNPVLKSKMPSFAHSIKSDVPEYSAEQVRKLLLFAKENDSHIYIFLLLALYTGLRKGELLALTWDDVDYDKKLLRVNKSRTGSRKAITTQITIPKTESSNRKIPLNDTVLEALKAEKKRQDEHAEILGNGYDKSSSFIIRTVLGKPYVNLSAINRVVNRLTEKAGLPHCTIHGFRHSVASILDDNGVPIQDISVLLGHESVQTTERIYINRRKTAKAETIETLGNAINLNIA
ncbi:MAG: tyrosine-type recombinase/integrase [Ruminococcus sp.]